MGYNDAAAGKCILDLETYRIDSAAEYIEDPMPPSNYVKPEAIANYVEKAKAGLLDKAALDFDLCRIVAVGLLSDDDGGPQVLLARDEEEEVAALTMAWYGIGEKLIIGFNVLNFDALVLLRRSLYLGITAPRLLVERFKHPRILDLMEELSFGRPERRHSLDFYCQRFGLDVPEDAVTGADIGRLVAAGDWEAVADHCRSDVLKTAALASRLGLFRQVSEAVL